MKEENKQSQQNAQVENEKQNTAENNQGGNSKFIDANQTQNSPGADRVAKTERKGAGQQQNSSGGPINS